MLRTIVLAYLLALTLGCSPSDEPPNAVTALEERVRERLD